MYLSTVEKLVQFLINPAISADLLCKYLALETFAQSNSSAVFIGGITQDGYIKPLNSFGNSQPLQDWGNVPLHINTPFTEAIKQDKVVLLKNEEMLVRYPALANSKEIPSHLQSYLVCPTLPLGIVAITLDTTPKLDRQFELFLRTVSTITLQHLLVKCRCDGTAKKPGNVGKLLKSSLLTERQQIIKSLIEKGLTNPAIADKIGYSESLVRQETMAIYAALNISGRKDLLG